MAKPLYFVLQPAPKEIYCRICLTTSITIKYKVISSLFNSDQTIAEILEDFAQIQILQDDTHSKLVCLECMEKLTVAVQLRNQIKESDNKIKYPLSETTENIENYGNLCHDEIKIEEPDIMEIKEEKPDPDDFDFENSTSDTTGNIQEELSAEDPLKIKRIKNEYYVNCPECPKVLTTYKSITEHSLIHDGLNRYRCSICNKGFFFKARYLNHEACHKDNKGFHCDTCGKSFKFHTMLVSHKLIHNEPKFRCAVCRKKFLYKTAFHEHQKMHINNPKYKCTFCYKKFTFKTAFQEHQTLHLNNPPYKCSGCDKEFTSLRRRFEHINEVHIKQKFSICEICGKSVRCLNNHLKLHSRAFECDICKQTFNNEESLNNHKVRHTEDVFYKCEICKKPFKYLKSLITHRRVHICGRQFACGLCDKRFNFKHHLKGHMLRIHKKKLE